MYGALLGFILGLLTRIKHQPHGQPYKATSRQENPTSQVGPIVISYTPPPLTNEEIAKKKEEERRTKTKFRIEKWGLLVLVLYTGFTGFMAWEMRESTKATKRAADAAKEAANVARDSFNMTKRHTEDSDEAFLRVVTLSLEPDRNVATIYLMNTGQVTAHGVTAHLEVWRASLPNGHREKMLGVIDFSQEELSKNDNINRQIVLPDFGKPDRERMLALKEGIAFNFTIAYENGFDTHRHPSGCQMEMTQLPNPGDSPQSPHDILTPCENVPAWLENDRIRRQRILDEKKSH